ncbi:MAG: PD-(D/E)XK nuclease family protein [Acidobacteria bacterium]|nr:MAG: PD-(D/E)XK nuclease family protein [Acidobacteriota bacterium]
MPSRPGGAEEEMTPGGGPRFSYSRLSTFRQCPRRYAFRYLEGVPEAFRTVESVLGSAVHAALRWLYERRDAGERPGVSGLVAEFDRRFDAELGPSVKVVRAGESVEDHRRRGRQLLERFHRDRFVADTTSTVSLESRFDIVLGGRFGFTGFIDRVAREPDGTLHVIDYKTTGRPRRSLDPDEALQLHAYGLACRRRHGGPIRVSFHYLEDGSGIGESFGDGVAARAERTLVSRIEEVVQARSFPPRPTQLCAWCGYRDRCEASGFADRAPTCPRCGGALRLRRGRRGPFWGCESFPDCRYTRDAGPGDVP